MSDLTLVIGNKNYSSWSLRPWILMKHLGVNFREVLVPLYQANSRDEIEQYSPSGKVPILRKGETCVWESLAICEYIAEITGRGWPKDEEARAVARSVSSEMHAGFVNLRSEWPMNARARNRRTAMTPNLQADLDRVEALWNDCRSRFGKRAGPWLFGEYSVADAMYAPVVLRLNTYAAQLADTTRWYMATVIEDPAMQAWLQAAHDEPWTIDASEVGIAH